MRIHLVGLRTSTLEAMIELHRLSDPPLHELIADADSADMIVFVGEPQSHGEGLVDNPLPKKYAEKCFMYWNGDGVVPMLPGIYTNATKPVLIDFRRIGSHMFIEGLNPEVKPMRGFKKVYLFSFAGGSTSILRKKLYKIDYGRDDILIRNTSSYYHWDGLQAGREARQREYAETIAASHFGLCPRGASAGGLRLFDVMQIGVAPVLISDAFVLPEGPDWSTFLIRVPERRLKKLPEILDRHQGQSSEMGRLAQEAWEKWFAPPVLFNNLIAAYVRMWERRRVPERWIHPFWGYMLWRRRTYMSTRSAARNAVLRVFRMLRLPFIYDLNRP
jgi:hypothetical protein